MDKPAVLLVDDNDATCTLVTAILERDFTVDVAPDGTAAVERLRTGKYVSILVDLGDDTYRTLDHLQREHPELVRRVLVLATSLSKKEMERVRQHNVFGVISKPFEVDLLLAAVKECAGRRGARNPLLTGGMLLLLADLLRQRWL